MEAIRLAQKAAAEHLLGDSASEDSDDMDDSEMGSEAAGKPSSSEAPATAVTVGTF